MPKEELQDLMKFLKPFPTQVRDITLWLREFLWDLYPDCNELIYDNYNALAIGFGTSVRAGDVFCSIAVFSKHVNFGFNRGSEITDKDKILKGDGSLYRYITIREKKDFPVARMKKLLREAHVNSLARLKGDKINPKGQTITKSISSVQRRPR